MVLRAALDEAVADGRVRRESGGPGRHAPPGQSRARPGLDEVSCMVRRQRPQVPRRDQRIPLVRPGSASTSSTACAAASCSGLKWGDIDLKARTVRIERGLPRFAAARRGRGHERRAPEGPSRSTRPTPQQLGAHLAAKPSALAAASRRTVGIAQHRERVRTGRQRTNRRLARDQADARQSRDPEQRGAGGEGVRRCTAGRAGHDVPGPRGILSGRAPSSLGCSPEDPHRV